MTALRPYRVSAMYEAHRGLGATFREDGDWRVPDAYGAPGEEAAGSRATVGLADASACGKLSVRGEGIDPLLAKVAGIERLDVASAGRFQLNGARVLAVRPVPDELLLLAPVADAAAVADAIRHVASGLGCAHLTDVTSGLAVLDLIGPRALDLLARLCPLDLASVPALGVVQGELARVHATVVRLDRPAGLAFRALVAREYGAFVWEAVTEAGHDLGLVPLGAAARALLDGGA